MSLLRGEPAFFDNLPEVCLPFTPEALASLKAGQLVSLSGTLYTGRDQTHRRLCALLAKKALLRPVGEKSGRADVAVLEERMLREINAQGQGVHGFGGSTTALAVHMEGFPCHIASLPVAVNIQCHAHRHKEIVL